MNVKMLCCFLLFTTFFQFPPQFQAAEVAKNPKRKVKSTCCPANKTRKSPITMRQSKLRNKYSKQTRLLKDIHEQQKRILSKYKGGESETSSSDRTILNDLLKELPDSIKNSNKYFFNKSDCMEVVVYDILKNKIEYKDRKKFNTPEKLLENIQKKQRNYLRMLQQKEYKKYSKK